MSEALKEMNPKGIMQHMEVFTAYAKGAKVEFKRPGEIEWKEIDDPSFNPNCQYRVKPEPMVVYINVYPENPHHHSRFGSIYTDEATCIIARHKGGKTRKFVEVPD